jgi:hypothetical protein
MAFLFHEVPDDEPVPPEVAGKVLGTAVAFWPLALWFEVVS